VRFGTWFTHSSRIVHAHSSRIGHASPPHQPAHRGVTACGCGCFGVATGGSAAAATGGLPARSARPSRLSCRFGPTRQSGPGRPVGPTRETGSGRLFGRARQWRPGRRRRLACHRFRRAGLRVTRASPVVMAGRPGARSAAAPDRYLERPRARLPGRPSGPRQPLRRPEPTRPIPQRRRPSLRRRPVGRGMRPAGRHRGFGTAAVWRTCSSGSGRPARIPARPP
jgi:hypothetical protein